MSIHLAGGHEKTASIRRHLSCGLHAESGEVRRHEGRFLYVTLSDDVLALDGVVSDVQRQVVLGRIEKAEVLVVGAELRVRLGLAVETLAFRVGLRHVFGHEDIHAQRGRKDGVDVLVAPEHG